MDAVDEAMARLAEMFVEESDEIILDALLKTETIEAAYDHIVEIQRTRRLACKQSDTTYQELVYLFPKIDQQYLVNIYSAFPNASLEELIDTVILQITNRKRVKFHRSSRIKCSGVGESTVIELSSPPTSYSQAVKEFPVDHVQTLSDVKGRVVSETDPTKFSYDFGLDDAEIDGQDGPLHRELAQDLIEERRKILGHACTQFQQGGLTGKGYAAYLSSQAKNLGNKIALHNAQAAYWIFHANNPDIEYSKTIDLHGLTIREAEPLVHAFLFHHFVVRDSETLTIITGQGNRSKSGARLRPAIYNLLTASQHRFSFDSFAIFSVYRPI